jgi:HEXXH motif-containing protein
MSTAGPAAAPAAGPAAGPTAVPEPILRELGRTEGGPEALALLVRDQDTRRLVLLRALLDAAEDAPAAVCPPESLDRLHRDWTLLETAERADRVAVRTALLYPLAGPWAQRCLNGLTSPTRPPVPPTTRPVPPPGPLPADLAHFSALAASAAIRTGTAFAGRLTAHDGLLVLPALGALRTAQGPPHPVDVTLSGDEVTLRQHDEATVTLRREAGGTVCDDPRWLPVLTLPPVRPGAAPVPLDDIHPYRTARRGREGYGPSAFTGPDDKERGDWALVWTGLESVLGIGGTHRPAEAAALLRCLVPLAQPSGPGADGAGTAQYSGTRREAFGAVLTSRPASPGHFAATLVHELQHTKLSALGALVPLHHEDGAQRHFAPWRPDPRPFDGLLQGAYSHLALADFWQRFALGAERVVHRDQGWAEHARCRAQLGAVLPTLAGSGALTREGRVLVDEMITMYHQLSDNPPPAGHLARAASYVRTARMIWQQRNSPGDGRRNGT